MQRPLVLLGASVVLACSADGGAAPKALDVSGTWSGSLTYQTAARTNTVPLSFTIVQAGSQVFGAMTSTDGTGTSTGGAVTGTQTGNSLSLTINGTRSAADDCYLYSNNLTFDAASDVLTLKAISGPECRGDGSGGHRSLDPIISGTLSMRKP